MNGYGTLTPPYQETSRLLDLGEGPRGSQWSWATEVLGRSQSASLQPNVISCNACLSSLEKGSLDSLGFEETHGHF